MEKYGSKSPLKKFIHNYTGFIIVGVFLAIALPIYYYETSSQEFFEKWTCANLQSYILTYDQDLYNRDFPDHDHLTIPQHTRLHEVISECDLLFEHR